MELRDKVLITLLSIIVIFFTINTIMVFTQLRAIQDKLEVTETTIEVLQELNLKMDSINNSFNNKIDEYNGILDSLPLGSPLDTVSISSNYGWRRSPFSRSWQRHSGIDLKGTYWDTVYSTGSGIVTMSGWNAGYGRCIIIDHVGGYKSKYAHLSRTFVKMGDSIIDGQSIGKCGKTGAVTGQHLHYEVIRNKETTDPYQYIFVDI
jgi:murein DD-endopeptidase MepM/ murein hydrolase activator NlpD